MKPHVKDIPCFKEVSEVIGRGNANIELFKVVTHKDFTPISYVFNIEDSPLIAAFEWDNTPQGWDFWCCINEGINPYE